MILAVKDEEGWRQWEINEESTTNIEEFNISTGLLIIFRELVYQFKPGSLAQLMEALFVKKYAAL